MKKFFKKTEGFTLVELIVVIAILGILAGIGTVGYSGYIKKANMAADQQLASEVKHALELYYYSNPTQDMAGTSVVLRPEGAVKSSATGVGDAAMDAVFGDGWENSLFLKYNGWKSTGVGANIAGSSFDGKIPDLLGKVDGLASDLSGFLEGYSGDNDFLKYLEDNNIAKNSTAAGNAAALYVAETLKGADQAEISNILSNMPSQIVSSYNDSKNLSTALSGTLLNTTAALSGQMGSDLAAVAVMYAYAESYAMATNQELEFDTSNIKNGSDAKNEIVKAFATMISKSGTAGLETWADVKQDGSSFVQGEGGKYKQDAKAVLSALNAVNNADSILRKELGTEGLFKKNESTVSEYLNASASAEDGTILVQIIKGEVFADPEP